METILYKKNYHRHENKELPHIHEKQIRTVMDFKWWNIWYFGCVLYRMPFLYFEL